jgi:hypothetical protein
MKTTIKVQSTSYTLQSFADSNTRHLTDEQRLQLRVNEITLLANRKHRKPALKKCPRVYPKFGAIQSTSQYVANYYAGNFGTQSTENMLAFFQPLSTRISVPMGEDTQEQDA